ncbi:MAG: aldo/keto reductase, partial [Phenylobacterium sp.]|nr:aldo/keto reductase [Phenylobacterium sp.]
VDHIDLYQMHHIDRLAPAEEIWQAMDRLIAQGKITYVGSSNFPGWKIAQLNERAQPRLGLVSEQSLYNLIERRAEMEVIPACQAYGLGVIAWSPLAGGLLAGNASANAGRRQTDDMKRAATTRADQLSRLADLCAELGRSQSAVALAWLLHQPGLTATIIGPGSLEQLTSILHAPDIELGADLLAKIDAIFPPVGPAPEAYAW